jgi:hypothetical protein
MFISRRTLLNDLVPRHEFVAFKDHVAAQLNGNAKALEGVSAEVAALRDTFKLYARLGGILVTVLGIAAPFIATYIHHP